MYTKKNYFKSYKGCNGNQNNFETREICENSCGNGVQSVLEISNSNRKGCSLSLITISNV